MNLKLSQVPEARHLSATSHPKVSIPGEGPDRVALGGSSPPQLLCNAPPSTVPGKSICGGWHGVVGFFFIFLNYYFYFFNLFFFPLMDSVLSPRSHD